MQVTEVTLSDGKKKFSFQVVGIDFREFRQKMIDFVEIDVNILLSQPKEEEKFFFVKTVEIGNPIEPSWGMIFQNQNKENYTFYLDEKMRKVERKTLFLQLTKELGATRKELEDWFHRNGCKLEFKED